MQGNPPIYHEALEAKKTYRRDDKPNAYSCYLFDFFAWSILLSELWDRVNNMALQSFLIPKLSDQMAY